MPSWKDICSMCVLTRDNLGRRYGPVGGPSPGLERQEATGHTVMSEASENTSVPARSSTTNSVHSGTGSLIAPEPAA